MAMNPNAELGSSGTATYPNGGPGAGYSSEASSADTAVRSLARKVYDNPLPVLAAGIGLALFLTSRSRPTGIARLAGSTLGRYAASQADLGAAADKLQRTARRAAKLARGEIKEARQSYENGRSSLADFASAAISAARERASALRDRASELRDGGLADLVTNNKPVALSVLGIALGALTAAVLPYARSHGWFGSEEDQEARW